MIVMPETKKIAAAFHQRAADYDQHIAVQKRVVDNLVEHVRSYPGLLPNSILDVGSGTGSLLRRLHSLWPDASLSGLDLAYNMCLRSADKLGESCLVVNGDAESLPFSDKSYDLVVSTSALQWAGNLSSVLSELQRVMKPGASLCVAFFCEGTLCELQRCLLEAAANRNCGIQHAGRLHKFWSIDDVKAILAEMEFEQVVVNCETEIDWYDDLHSLLRSIKNIGAGTVSGGVGGGLGWRGVINETARLYREYYGENNKIPVTYKVLYLHASSAHL